MSGTTAETMEIRISTQYTKRCRFEVENAPAIFTTSLSQPHVALSVDIAANQMGENQPIFEVVLIMTLTAYVTPPDEQTPEPKKMFEIYIEYGAIVFLKRIEEVTFEKALLIEAPKLIFPGIRQLIATLTHEGGFPALWIQPVDFQKLWEDRQTQSA